MEQIKHTLFKVYLLKNNPGLGFECGFIHRKHPFYPVISFFVEIKRLVMFIFEMIHVAAAAIWAPCSRTCFNKRIGIPVLMSLVLCSPMVSAIQTTINQRTKRLFTSKEKQIVAPVNCQFDAIIVRASRKYNIDPVLIKSMIKAESDFNPRIVSRAGAKGLMQLMPATARQMGVKNIFDPEENIMAGTRFLNYMLIEFNYDIKKALAAYNAGPGHVRRYNGIPPFPETKSYLRKIERNYKDFIVDLKDI